MENHPIPQNVTGFKFKLIGDMTVKQFAYLGGGVFLAWIVYLFKVAFIIKLPFMLAFAGLGFALAFIPLEGRPLDLMISYFLKALFVPSQYIYKKVGVPMFSPALQPNTTLHAVAQPVAALSQQINPATPTSSPTQSAQKSFVKQPRLLTMSSMQLQKQNPPSAPLPDAVPLQEKKVEAAPSETDEKLQQEVQGLKKQLDKAKELELQYANIPNSEQMHQKLLELETQLQEVLNQKEQLQNQLVLLKKDFAAPRQEVHVPSLATTAMESSTVRKLTPSQTIKSGTPMLASAPNQITGIIKDPRGNVLQNILVEVKDSAGNSVRAFKTNRLGQFASATSLLPGTYTVTFEDPQSAHTFDAVQITANNEMLPTLEITSEDQREKLRKQLFN